jgi:hypothetical protein
MFQSISYSPLVTPGFGVKSPKSTDSNYIVSEEQDRKGHPTYGEDTGKKDGASAEDIKALENRKYTII